MAMDIDQPRCYYKWPARGKLFGDYPRARGT
jgi:hypothetical protein